MGEFVPLAPEHAGMRVDCHGMLSGARRLLKFYRHSGDAFLLEEFLRHLEEMGSRFYAGDLSVVDEFLQLYCIAPRERAIAASRAQSTPAEAKGE